MSKGGDKHSIVRTSPKGGPFLGTCTQCGADNLTMSDALRACPNPAGRTKTQSLLDVISPKDRAA
jgi:hypothetical protein